MNPHLWILLSLKVLIRSGVSWNVKLAMDTRLIFHRFYVKVILCGNKWVPDDWIGCTKHACRSSESNHLRPGWIATPTLKFKCRLILKVQYNIFTRWSLLVIQNYFGLSVTGNSKFIAEYLWTLLTRPFTVFNILILFFRRTQKTSFWVLVLIILFIGGVLKYRHDILSTSNTIVRQLKYTLVFDLNSDSRLNEILSSDILDTIL